MKKIAITGVTSGFGVEWLYQLDKSESAVFFVLARNEARFTHMLKNMPLRNKVHFIHCDLSSLDSVCHAAEEVTKLTSGIDVLINNAGVWAGDDFFETEDGVELTLAVNHLAPFVLTRQLMGLLEKSSDARIVNTASFRYTDAKVDKKDIELRNNFSAEQAYCNSKLYSILFTKKLAGLLKHHGITVNCFDPGIVDTPMLRLAFPKKLLFLYPLFRRYFARKPDRGAETGVYLSVSPLCKGISGQYFKDTRIKRPGKMARDDGLADWLWEESVRLTGFEY